MAKEVLSTDLKDDVLSEEMNGRRRYVMIDNGDGTISLEDASTYEQQGSVIGQALLNGYARAINESIDKAVIVEKLSDVAAVTENGFLPGAQAVAELNKKIGNVETSFQDGCSTIAAAITSMGVSTSATASPSTMAANVKKILTLLGIFHSGVFGSGCTLTISNKGYSFAHSNNVIDISTRYSSDVNNSKGYVEFDATHINSVVVMFEMHTDNSSQTHKFTLKASKTAGDTNSGTATTNASSGWQLKKVTLDVNSLTGTAYINMLNTNTVNNTYTTKVRIISIIGTK